jgi:hypothetical protein
LKKEEERRRRRRGGIRGQKALRDTLVEKAQPWTTEFLGSTLPIDKAKKWQL